MKSIYLDYAATTPVDPAVVKAMAPYFSADFGNPGSLHQFGQRASAAVFRSRQIIAKAIGAHYSEIIFTGSATEANNLALRGTMRRFWWNYFKEHGKKSQVKITPHIIISAIEHESIFETARDIELRGAAKVTIVPVDKNGLINLAALKRAFRPETVLVSVMYANNEIGSIQPIREIAKIIADFKNSKHEARNSKQIRNSKIKNSKFVSDFEFRDSDFAKVYPLLHVDAVQAFQYLDCNVDALGVDLMTLSAHKIYGPKGIGLLYVRKEDRALRTTPHALRNAYSDMRIAPLITGGGQENGLRSGTENVPAIVGFAKAVELTVAAREKESARVRILRDYCINKIKKIWPGAKLNGSVKDPVRSRADSTSNGASRLPNNVNIYLPSPSRARGLTRTATQTNAEKSLNGEQLLVALDLAGIAISSGPACSARSLEPSKTLLAMGYSKQYALNSFRITLGRMTTKKDIDVLVAEILKLKSAKN